MGVMRATDQVTIVEGGIGDTTELETKVEELNNNLASSSNYVTSSYLGNISYAKSGNVCQVRINNVLSSNYNIDADLAEGLPKPKLLTLGTIFCSNGSTKLLRITTNGVLQIPESINSGVILSGTITYITNDVS